MLYLRSESCEEREQYLGNQQPKQPSPIFSHPKGMHGMERHEIDRRGRFPRTNHGRDAEINHKRKSWEWSEISIRCRRSQRKADIPPAHFNHVKLTDSHGISKEQPMQIKPTHNSYHKYHLTSSFTSINSINAKNK